MPYQQFKAADPLAKALEVAGLPTASWIVAFGAVVSLTAVLLVFQYGQPRIFLAMARDGLLPGWACEDPSQVPHPAHHDRDHRASSSPLGGLVMDENEIYDLTNIGTLAAFAIVCVGVLVLRYKDPERPRPFRVPFVWPVARRGGRGLHLHDEGAAHPRLGAVRHLAGRRAGAVLRVRLPAQQVAPAVTDPLTGLTSPTAKKHEATFVDRRAVGHVQQRGGVAHP